VITTATMKGFNAMTDVEVLDYVVSIASDQHTNIEMKKNMDKGAAESEWEYQAAKSRQDRHTSSNPIFKFTLRPLFPTFHSFARLFMPRGRLGAVRTRRK
jgi:hypothetical protein